MYSSNGVKQIQYNPWKPQSLLISVAIFVILIIVGFILGLSLGIGLNDGDQNLSSIITSTNSTYNTTTFITTTTTTTTFSLITLTYASELTTNSSSFTRLSQSNDSFYYQSLRLFVDRSALYTITAHSFSFLYVYLYNNTFDPNNSSINLLNSAFDTIIIPNLSFSTNLNTGIIYVLVITTVDSTDTGSFNITVSGLGNIFIIPISNNTTTTTTNEETE